MYDILIGIISDHSIDLEEFNKYSSLIKKPFTKQLEDMLGEKKYLENKKMVTSEIEYINDCYKILHGDDMPNNIIDIISSELVDEQISSVKNCMNNFFATRPKLHEYLVTSDFLKDLSPSKKAIYFHCLVKNKNYALLKKWKYDDIDPKYIPLNRIKISSTNIKKLFCLDSYVLFNILKHSYLVRKENNVILTDEKIIRNHLDYFNKSDDDHAPQIFYGIILSSCGSDLIIRLIEENLLMHRYVTLNNIFFVPYTNEKILKCMTKLFLKNNSAIDIMFSMIIDKICNQYLDKNILLRTVYVVNSIINRKKVINEINPKMETIKKISFIIKEIIQELTYEKYDKYDKIIINKFLILCDSIMYSKYKLCFKNLEELMICCEIGMTNIYFKNYYSPEEIFYYQNESIVELIIKNNANIKTVTNYCNALLKNKLWVFDMENIRMN